MIDRFNKFEIEKVTQHIEKCRKYIPKDKLDEWDIFVLKAKWKNMRTGKGLCKIVNIVDVITAIEKGKKQGKDMKESLKGIKQPFKYYLLVAKFSRFGQEYLEYGKKLPQEEQEEEKE